MAKPTKKKNKKKKVTAQQPIAASSFWKTPMARYSLLLVVLSFLVFGNSISNGFTYDDKPFISKNYLVQQGFSGIPTLLTTDFWAGYTTSSQANPSYRPVPLITLAVEHGIFGLSAPTHHFFNVLWYALTVVLLYWLLQLLFKDRYPGVALAAAILFCVHPIHTEVVANIKGRDDLLALFFALLSLYLIVQQVQQKKGVGYLAGAAVAFFLAMLSKAHVLAFVAIVPLVLYFFTDAKRGDLLKMTALVLVSGLLFLGLQSAIIEGGIVQVVGEIENPILAAETTSERWATTVHTWLLFIQKLLWPLPLSSDYGFAVVKPVGWSAPGIYVSLLLYGALAYFAIRGLRSKQPYAFAIILFLVTLAPISHIAFPYVVAFAERAMFTPSWGGLLLLTLIGYHALAYAQEKGWIKDIAQRNRLGTIALAVVCLVFAIISFQRNPAWENDGTLFSTDVKTMPESLRMNVLLATKIIEENTKSQPVPMNAELTAAKQYLDQASTIYPNLTKLITAYGNLYKTTGAFEQANQYYDQVLEQEPENPNVLFSKGVIAQMQNDLSTAERFYTRSLEIFPNYPVALSNLGIVYGSTNRLDECIEVLEKAIQLQPDMRGAYDNLERAYNLKGDPEKAAYYKRLRGQLPQQ
ncbi:MAG: tetratricopeptide repeat protein [Bacteroidota bacterium]